MPTPESSFNWNRHALLTCDEMRCAEQLCCAEGRFSYYDLMQNAGHAVARIIQDRWKPCRVLVMCGPGNNGGDGYVVAETLRKAGWPVFIGALPSNSLPPDAAQAVQEWHGETRPLTPDLFEQVDMVVDALFGTGLQRPLAGEIARTIDKLKARNMLVVAIDMASGVDGDTGQSKGTAVQAQVTVTFFRKKWGHVLLPGAVRNGETVVTDIGISPTVLNEIKPSVAENHPDLWLSDFPFPQPEGHKYSRGHALILGGAVMTGASRLAARAAQRLGAGLVTLGVPDAVLSVYATSLESVLVRRAETLDEWRAMLDDPKRNTVLVGPGLGANGAAKELVLAALETRKQTVLDADALTVFADGSEALFHNLHPNCVLTPHEGEFMRLFGARIDAGANKIARVRKAAEMAGCVVLLKGADTVIADPEGRVVVNTNAPAWLATGGSGDVLAGMILGLLTPGMPLFQSAAAACWIHGRIAGLLGPGLIAEDLVNSLPSVLKDLSAVVGKPIVGPL